MCRNRAIRRLRERERTAGTRFDKLYPGDKKILKSLGYNKKDVEILFSGTPNQPPYSHLIAVGARSGLLDTSASVLQYTPTGKYYYRKMDVGQNTVLQAIIPFEELNYGLVSYIAKGESTSDFEHLLEKNVRMPNRPHNFMISKTEIDCEVDVQKNVDIEIPRAYINRDIYTLTKVMKKESYVESLAVYTLNGKDVNPQVVFKLCSGSYRVVYSDLSHQELWNEDIEVR